MSSIPSTLPEKPALHAAPMIAESAGPLKPHGAAPIQQMELLQGRILLKATRTAQAVTEEVRPNMSPGGEWPKKAKPAYAARSADRYIRFRVRVDNGKMSIVDAHAIEGTLLTPASVGGNFVYEVLHGQQRLHADSIPEPGVRRSFADPNAPPQERREKITELTTYEFDIHIPEKDLTLEALPDISVTLYRAKEPVTGMKVGPMPMGAQFEKELREIAYVKGIPANMLPK